MMQNLALENTKSARLEQYFLILYRSRWTILFILLLAVMTAFIKNDVSQPIYQATVKLWVKQQEGSSAGGGLENMFMNGLFGRTAQLETYCEIIRSSSSLEQVIEDLDLVDDPLPKHRGQIVTWISQKLGFLTGNPLLSRKSYEAFRQAWVAVEVPYLADMLEASLDASDQPDRVQIRPFLERLEQLGRISEPVANALAQITQQQGSQWVPQSPTELQRLVTVLRTLPLNPSDSVMKQLASQAFRARRQLDTVFSMADRAQLSAVAHTQGTLAAYELATQKLREKLAQEVSNTLPRKSLGEDRRILDFRTFRDYVRDPSFNYGEYRRLILHHEQELRFKEEYAKFLKENKEHPDRHLWTEAQFREHYRRLQKDELLRKLQKWVKVQPTREADVIRITVNAPTHERAVTIANRLAANFEAYIVDDARKRMQKTARFAEGQLQVVEENLKKAAEALSNFQQQHQVVSLTAEGEALLQGLHQLDQLLAQAKYRKEGAERQIATLQAELQQQEPTITATQTFSTNPVLQQLRVKLKESQIELARLKRRYPPGHEEIRRQEAVVQEWEKELATVTKEEITRTISPNPLVANLTDLLIQAQSKKVAAEAEIETLTAQIEEYKGRLAQMPELERQLAEYKRNVMFYESLLTTLTQAEQEAKMLSEAEPGNITTFQRASLSEMPVPISPRRKLNVLLGALVGLLFGIGVAFLREYLDNTYGTIEEAQHDLELVSRRVNPEVVPTFLTMVPMIGAMQEDERYIAAAKEPLSAAAESFRILRTKLQFLGAGAPVKCILVTSAAPGEGKSTISSNLAAVLAQQMDKRVLLMDADLRKPKQYKIFAEAMSLPSLPAGAESASEEASEDTSAPVRSDIVSRAVPAQGTTLDLSSLLLAWGEMVSREPEDSLLHRWFKAHRQVPDGVHPTSDLTSEPVLDPESEAQVREKLNRLLLPYIRKVRLEVDASTLRRHGIKNPEGDTPTPRPIEFDLLPNRLRPPNPSELLGSEGMAQLLEYLRTIYDYIVIDSPPVKAASDAIILSSYVDTVVYTFDIVKTKRFDVRSALEELLEANPRSIGTVCNLTELQGGYYGYGGRYGYNKYGYYYGRYRYSYYYDYYRESGEEGQQKG